MTQQLREKVTTALLVAEPESLRHKRNFARGIALLVTGGGDAGAQRLAELVADDGNS